MSEADIISKYTKIDWEKISETEEIDFRKKIESEYTPSFMHTSPTSDDYAKDFKSKIYSTTHSR